MTDLFHSLMALGIIIPLIVAVVYILKRFSSLQVKKPRSLKLIDQLSLGSKHYIAIVETEDVQLILGMSPNQMDILHQSKITSDGANHD